MSSGEIDYGNVYKRQGRKGGKDRRGREDQGGEEQGLGVRGGDHLARQVVTR